MIGHLLADLAFFQINVLLQAFISQLKLEGFALMADMVYVTQVRAHWCCQERRPKQFQPLVLLCILEKIELMLVRWGEGQALF